MTLRPILKVAEIIRHRIRRRPFERGPDLSASPSSSGAGSPVKPPPVPATRDRDIREVYCAEVRHGTGCKVLLP